MLHVLEDAELGEGVGECLDGHLVLVGDGELEQLVWNRSNVSGALVRRLALA